MSRDFAETLVRYRALRGLTQQQLGDLAGVSPSQISRYEAGTAKPRRTVMQNLADALDISIDDLHLESDIESREISLDLSDIATQQLEKLAEQKGIPFNQAAQLVLLLGMKDRMDQDPSLREALEQDQPGAYQSILDGIANDGAPPTKKPQK